MLPRLTAAAAGPPKPPAAATAAAVDDDVGRFGHELRNRCCLEPLQHRVGHLDARALRQLDVDCTWPSSVCVANSVGSVGE